MNRHRLRQKHLQDALTKVIEYHSTEYEITLADIAGVLSVLIANTLRLRPDEDEDDEDEDEWPARL